MFFIQGGSWELSIVGLALSLFTLINVMLKLKKHKTDLLLLLWLLILNVPLIHCITDQMHLDNFSFRFFTNMSLNLLHGPLLYYYVLILVKKNFVLKPTHLLHLLPFLVFYVGYIISPPPFPLPPTDFGAMPPFPLHGISQPLMINTDLFRSLLFHFGVINIVSFIIYSLLSIALLIQHQSKIQSYFSQQDNQITLKWLYLLPMVFTLLMLTNLINELGFFGDFLVSPITLHLLSNFTFILLLCFFGVKQSPLYKEKKGILDKTEQIKNMSLEEKRQKSDTQDILLQKEVELNNTELTNKVLQKVDQYMLDHKPYLDPSLSLHSLSQAIEISKQSLSQAVNSGEYKNFFQYINKYRVNEAQSKLRDSKEEHFTILDIALASGFNSKSSFYNLFKQHCQLSPLQYRKKHLSK